MNTYLWEVTNYCPLECGYCYTDSGPWRPNTDAKQLFKVAEAIVREKGRRVIINGGEPTAAKGIIEIAEYLRANDVSLTMCTSGWSLAGPRAERLGDLVDRFHVSIDAASAELNDRIRGKAGAHRNATRALKTLSRLRREKGHPSFGVDCTVVRDNLPYLREFCEFMATSFEGLSFINIAPAVPTGRGSKLPFCNTNLLSREQFDALLGQTQELRKVVPVSVHLTVRDNEFLDAENHVISLNPAGDVRLLNISPASMGNLLDEPLATILKRGATWKENSPLARGLKAAPDFVALGDIVRRLDAEFASS